MSAQNDMQTLQNLWAEHLHVALGMEYLSVSALQRRLRMSYGNACLLLDVLQAHGVLEQVQVFAVKNTLGDLQTRMPHLQNQPSPPLQLPGGNRRALEQDFRQALLADLMSRLNKVPDEV